MDIETPAGSPRYGGGGLLPGPSSGCGTGEHAEWRLTSVWRRLAWTRQGQPLRLRKRKARERGLAADSWFPRRFAWRRSSSRSIPSLDCGLFHVFGDKDRRSFEEKHHFSRSAKWTLLDAVSQQVSTRGHGSSAGYAIQDPDQFRPWLARGFD